MIRLYITSTGRAQRQLTWRRLPKRYRKLCKVVIYREERDEYKAEGLPTLVYPGPRGLSGKRQWIIEWHRQHCDTPYLILLDDDLDFQKRRKDNPKRAKVATRKGVGKMLDKVTYLLTKYAHAGVLLRNLGAVDGFTERSCTYTSRMLNVLGYNTDILAKHKVRFDRVPCMSDFDVTLQLLELGYKNAIYCKYLQGQSSQHSGFSGIGGCSTYRTPEMQKQSALKLAKLHKGLVKIVTRKTKMSWGGGERTDVRISWKKALGAK